MNLWTAHWDALSVPVQSRACFPSSVRENIMKAPASSAARSPKRPAPRRSLIGKKETPPASTGGVFLSLLSLWNGCGIGPFQATQKEKQKRWRKVLTKGEKGGILTKLSREGRWGSENWSRTSEKSSWQRGSDLIELSSCTSQDANEINGSRLNPKETLKKVVDKREWVW